MQYSGAVGTSPVNARAAANDDVECEDGNERPVGVAIRCGRASTTGRGRPIDHLIELEVGYAQRTAAVARIQRGRAVLSSTAPSSPAPTHKSPCSPSAE